MNWDQIKGNWHQVKGLLRERWGHLTNDDVEQISGEQERLLGLLQARYGLVREEAERQVREFCKTCTSDVS